MECPEIHLRIHLGIIKGPEGPKCVSALNVGSSLLLSPPIQFIKPIKRSWRSPGLVHFSKYLTKKPLSLSLSLSDSSLRADYCPNSWSFPYLCIHPFCHPNRYNTTRLTQQTQHLPKSQRDYSWNLMRMYNMRREGKYEAPNTSSTFKTSAQFHSEPRTQKGRLQWDNP